MSLALLVLLGCGQPVAPAPEPEPAAPRLTLAERSTEPLPAPLLLRRLSLDLRGTLPTLAELDAVEADPAALEGLLDTLLADPRLGDRLVALLGELWLTRVDTFNLDPIDYGLDDAVEYSFLRSVGEEPLRLAAEVAVQDLPWTDVVTVDWTLGNDLLAEIWELDCEEGEGWRRCRYTDGRPAGGVLMTNGLWWRYYTTPNNYNRSRAAALSRLFLCEDFLLRPVSFEAPRLLDRESLNEAIRLEPACVSCHSAMDPLASAMFGFWWFDLYDTSELSRYHPEREWLGEYYLEVAPAWFGEALSGPGELGPRLAADPRFSSCTVETFARGLWRRELVRSDTDELLRLRDAWVAQDDAPLRPLLRALVQSATYTAGSLTEDAPAEAESLTTLRLMSAEVLASAVEELTGFTWTFEGFDQLDNDLLGYRVLLGGVDGHTVTSPERNPSISRAVAVRRLAEAAASTAVAAAFDNPDPEGLFSGMTSAHTPDDPAFVDALDTLHRRLFAELPTDEERAAALAFWAEVRAVSGPRTAWAALLAAWLRDPRFSTY